MQYQVPQFIEIEDKVIGPLTFKQFVYVLGGGGISFALYVWLPFLLALPLIGLALGTAATFAFYKVNNKPFVYILESALKYVIGSKLYIWKKETKKPKAKEEENIASETLYVPTLSESKLNDIAWSLDVHETDTRPTTNNLQHRTDDPQL